MLVTPSLRASRRIGAIAHVPAASWPPADVDGQAALSGAGELALTHRSPGILDWTDDRSR
jgi:hypothetical protein